MTIKLALLGSTNGSIVPALVDQLENLPTQITRIISNRADAGLLQKAEDLNLPATFLSSQSKSRQQFDLELSKLLQQHQIDLVLLIGYMRILSNDFVQEWRHRLLNIHPSLLPKHKDLMDLAVHQAAIDAGDKVSGCSVHFVTEEVDGGEVIVQKQCEITKNETALSLKKKVQQLEAIAMAEAVGKWLEECSLDGEHKAFEIRSKA